MPTFTLLYNEKTVKTYHFDEPVVTIGRLPENTISIPSMSVSRRHARIEEVSGGRHVLIDLNSLNGTFHKSTKVTHVPLASGDRFTIGTYSIIFEDDGATPELMPAPPTSGRTGRSPSADERPTTAVVRDANPVLIETTKHIIYKLIGDSMMLGNSEVDQIFVEGPFIAEGHVILEKRDEGWWILSRKMLGKFRVNGKKLKSHRLRHKDRIEVGSSTFRFMENE